MKNLKLLLLTTILAVTTGFAQVNINTATVKELSALLRIGPKKAKAIIKYREANGRFKTVYDLVNVKGIGEQTIKNLGSDIQVGGRTDVTKLKHTSKTKKSTEKAINKKAKKTTKKSTKKKTTKKQKKVTAKKKAN